MAQVYPYFATSSKSAANGEAINGSRCCARPFPDLFYSVASPSLFDSLRTGVVRLKSRRAICVTTCVLIGSGMGMGRGRATPSSIGSSSCFMRSIFLITESSRHRPYQVGYPQQRHGIDHSSLAQLKARGHLIEHPARNLNSMLADP